MSIERSRVAVAILLVCCASCASAPKLPVFGTWRIQSYTSPGLSAASPVQSLSWVGTSASFAKEDARFGGERCSQPKYTLSTLSAADFQQQFKVAPSAAGLTGDSFPVYQLDCSYDWQGPTHTLIVKSPTSLLAPWNGSMLELVKFSSTMK